MKKDDRLESIPSKEEILNNLFILKHNVQKVITILNNIDDKPLVSEVLLNNKEEIVLFFHDYKTSVTNAILLFEPEFKDKKTALAIKRSLSELSSNIQKLYSKFLTSSVKLSEDDLFLLELRSIENNCIKNNFQISSYLYLLSLDY